ncbi:MAG: hypothetical protein ACKO2N_01170 [Tabrizicola sp.]
MSGLVRDRIGSAGQALAARLPGLVLRINAWWRRPTARTARIGLSPSVDAATRLEISLRGGFPR